MIACECARSVCECIKALIVPLEQTLGINLNTMGNTSMFSDKAGARLKARAQDITSCGASEPLVQALGVTTNRSELVLVK